MSRTNTDSYRKRLCAAVLITLALYCIVGGAFVVLPMGALFLSPRGTGGGNGVLLLGMAPGTGSGDTGGEGGHEREGSPRTENAPASQIAPVEPAKAEANGASGSGSARGPTGTGNADSPDGTGGPGYGTGGNGSGGSFVDAVGDATTAPFISWVDRSIRKRLYYPEKARLRNLEGTVTLGMAVPADGSRCEVVLAKSSGHEVLDHAAIGLVRSLFPAKVAPGRDFSAPVRIRYTLTDN